MSNAIEHPEHYTSGTVEVIEMMHRIWGREAVKVFCELNAFKYRMRAGKKDSLTVTEDIGKAAWYESKLKQLSE